MSREEQFISGLQKLIDETQIVVSPNAYFTLYLTDINNLSLCDGILVAFRIVEGKIIVDWSAKDNV